jgi:hypothetical protein
MKIWNEGRAKNAKGVEVQKRILLGTQKGSANYDAVRQAHLLGNTALSDAGASVAANDCQLRPWLATP